MSNFGGAKRSAASTANGTRYGYQTSSGQAGVGYRGPNGSIANTTNGVYAGHDGNVYKKNSDGSCNQNNNGSWNPVDTTAAKQQAQQNIQSRQQAAGTQPAGSTARTAPTNTSASQTLGSGSSTPQATTRTAPSSETMQGLNNSAQARQVGQQQTQRFQNRRQSGGFHRRR